MSDLISTGSLLFINATVPSSLNSWFVNQNAASTGSFFLSNILLTNGNPSGLIYLPASGIAYDVTGGSLYMFGGSPTDWIALGSVAY
jgi:hypothetical protein